jgi:hypothetical protein
MSDSEEQELERYARLVLALAEPKADRGAILAAQQLNDESFEALETHWLGKLAQAEDAFGDADGVPPLLARYGAAMSRAQASHARGAMDLEQYAAITRALSRGRDVEQLLERHGTTLATYLHAHAQWTGRAAREPGVAERLAELLRNG